MMTENESVILRYTDENQVIKICKSDFVSICCSLRILQDRIKKHQYRLTITVIFVTIL